MGQPVIVLGDGVPVYEAVLKKTLRVPWEKAPLHLNRQRASSIAALAMVYAREGKQQTAREHRPQYLRMSQAERERLSKETEAK